MMIGLGCPIGPVANHTYKFIPKNALLPPTPQPQATSRAHRNMITRETLTTIETTLTRSTVRIPRPTVDGPAELHPSIALPEEGRTVEGQGQQQEGARPGGVLR